MPLLMAWLMKYAFLFSLLFLTLFGCAQAHPVNAKYWQPEKNQSVGSLKGIVLDESNIPIVGATIEIKCNCIKSRIGTVADLDGAFFFQSVPVCSIDTCISNAMLR